MLARLLPLAFDPATENVPALRQALSAALEAFAGLGTAATTALVRSSSSVWPVLIVHETLQLQTQSLVCYAK